MKSCMRFLSAVIAALLLIVCITGCGSGSAGILDNDFVTNETTPVTNKTNSKFEAFEMERVGYSSSGGFDYYRDTVTDVIYIRYREMQINEGAGGLTVMLDPETGLPLTYTRYNELYNAKAKE